MDSRKIVFHETGILAAGMAICVGLMFGIYALLGRFDSRVLWGGLTGTLVTLLNFFVMAIVTMLAADKAQQQDVASGRKLLKGAYPLRLLVLAVVLFACAKSGFFDVLALVLPLAFVRPILTIAEFFRKKGA